MPQSSLPTQVQEVIAEVSAQLGADAGGIGLDEIKREIQARSAQYDRLVEAQALLTELTARGLTKPRGYNLMGVGQGRFRQTSGLVGQPTQPARVSFRMN